MWETHIRFGITMIIFTEDKSSYPYLRITASSIFGNKFISISSVLGSHDGIALKSYHAAKITETI